MSTREEATGEAGAGAEHAQDVVTKLRQAMEVWLGDGVTDDEAFALLTVINDKGLTVKEVGEE